MSNFDFAAYIPQALRTEAPLPTVFHRLEHALLGLITETGEFTTEIKRIAIYGKGIDSLAKDGKTTLRQHIAEEIGDTLWYAAIAADALGMQGVWLEQAPTPELLDVKDLPHVARSIIISVGNFAQASAVPTMISADPTTLVSILNAILHKLNTLSGLIGIPLQQIADDNIAKLKERFPDAFSAEAAEARADKGGADARNS